MRSVRTQYKGQWFDSKKEAAYAQKLDLRVISGEIVAWRKAESVFLQSNGIQLVGPTGRRLYYRPDFEITHGDGRVEFVDVKGRRSTKDPAYRLFWFKKEVLRANGVEVTEA